MTLFEPDGPGEQSAAGASLGSGPSDVPGRAAASGVPGQAASDGHTPARPPAVPAGVPGLCGSRDDVRGGVLTAVVLGLLGLATGALWLWLAPRAQFRVTDANGGLEVVGGGLVSPELFMSGDGVYVLLLAGLGLMAGLAAWFRRARRGVVTLVAVAVGMVLASLVTWGLGARLGRGPSAEELATTGTVVTTALDLGALAALAVGPFVAVLVYLVATVLVSRDDLGRGGDALRAPVPVAAVEDPGPSAPSPAHPQAG